VRWFGINGDRPWLVFGSVLFRCRLVVPSGYRIRCVRGLRDLAWWECVGVHLSVYEGACCVSFGGYRVRVSGCGLFRVMCFRRLVVLVFSALLLLRRLCAELGPSRAWCVVVAWGCGVRCSWGVRGAVGL